MASPFDMLGPEFYGFLLPWIFTFAIVYGLLAKMKLFGEATQKISVALALVVAFFVTAVGGPAMASFFVTLFGGAAIYLAGILVVLLFLEIAGFSGKLKEYTIVMIILIVLGIALFYVAGGAVPGVSIDQTTMSLVFWVIVIAAVIYLVTRESKSKETTTTAAGQAEKPS